MSALTHENILVYFLLQFYYFIYAVLFSEFR